MNTRRQIPLLIAKLVRAIHPHFIHALFLGLELTFLLMVQWKMKVGSTLMFVSGGAVIQIWVGCMATLGEVFPTGQHRYQMALSLSSMDLLMEVSSQLFPQFPASPMLGIRPSLEISHSGIPYGMPDAERFPSNLHPLGWQNMLDGSSPSHLHGWDGNNGIFRDESRIYNGAEWDENRQMVNGRGWESRADMWKRQSGYLKRELPFHFHKNDHAMQNPANGISSEEVCDESSSCILQKTAEMKPSIASSATESPSAPELLSATPAPLRRSMDDDSKLSRAYLSKLEISSELANPDLYHQCRKLMDIEQSAPVNEESAVCIIVEGGIVVSMSSNNVRQSFSHPVKNSVFQRAVDLYSKQRMEMKEIQFVTGGKLDGILASSEGRHEEPGLNFNDEKVKTPPSTVGEEISHVPLPLTMIRRQLRQLLGRGN